MAKKVAGYLKLQVPAGAANPSPPIGPALGQRGINIMEFCKAFNARSQEMEKGSPIPVVATPAGTSPVFMTMWRLNDGLGRVYTPSFSNSQNPIAGGGGGGVCSGNFCPACFTVGAPAVPDNLPNITFINYCVFKNAN